MAQGVSVARQGPFDGNALGIVRSVAETHITLEAWRHILAEFGPHEAGRCVNMSEAVMDGHQRSKARLFDVAPPTA